VPRAIPEPPFDVEALIPEFAGLARETVLLYPRSGDPGVHESSMGGPLLWPAGEPWPYCDQSGHWAAGPGFEPGGDVTLGAVPMVPVVQLFARDVPQLEFPTPTVEYPTWDLPEELRQALLPRLKELEDRFDCWYADVASALQNKVGGYPAWTQPPDWPHCARGHRMEHLLSVTGETGYGRWLPVDEHRPGSTRPLWHWESQADPAVLDTLGPDMDMGDAGGIYLFLCRQCPACRTRTASTATGAAWSTPDSVNARTLRIRAARPLCLLHRGDEPSVQRGDGGDQTRIVAACRPTG
jgi:hypothetical protein